MCCKKRKKQQAEAPVQGVEIPEDEINERHLEFIETTITRMSKNSSQAKTWCVTIIAALVAFYLTQGDTAVHIASGLFSISITVLFFAIDVYYLYLERGYRFLYKVAAKMDKVDLEKDHQVFQYSMEIPKSQRGAKKYFKAMDSASTGLFYGVLALIQILLVIFYR